MRKYLAIGKITFSNILRYRFEFFTIQLRALITLVTLYFLWITAFGSHSTLFGYTREELVSYVFIATIIRSFVLVTIVPEMGNEIAGNSTFYLYLTKPIGYLSTWLTRDLVGKVYNTLIFFVIFLIFVNLFHVQIVIAGSLALLLFLASVAVACLLYFYISSTVSFSAFWNKGIWGSQFVLILFVEFLSGMYFPLSVLPEAIQKAAALTPFPYLLYYPVQILTGKVNTSTALGYLVGGVLWTVAAYFLTRFIFAKGLKRYEALGG